VHIQVFTDCATVLYKIHFIFSITKVSHHFQIVSDKLKQLMQYRSVKGQSNPSILAGCERLRISEGL